jgi:haloalkane dehalogenase
MRVVRTPPERFASVPDYPFGEHWHVFREPGGQELRMHYVDEGEGPPILLLHGQPMWSWLYREFVSPLVEAGYRCVVPDYIGFGKSDKVVEDEWYVIERHCEVIRSLIDALDLRDCALGVHDWGGPIGLRQAVDQPARFSRLFVLNTWLHHIDMKYTAGIRGYHAQMAALEPGKGDIWDVMGRMKDAMPRVWAGVEPPFASVEHMAGARRFPLLHPYADPVGGNAVDQARCYERLLSWPKPAHLIFSHADPVFPPAWGRAWAQRFPFGSYDQVETDPPLHHFLQLSRAREIVALMLGYLRE